MALNASGTIAIGGTTVGQSINLDIGRSATACTSLNDSQLRSLAVKPSGQIALSNFYGKSGTGQVSYTTPGTYTWVCPAGVTSISVLCIGGGAGGDGGDSGLGFGFINAGGGGGLGYLNNYAVNPGSSYTVVVGSAGVSPLADDLPGSDGTNSYFINTSTVRGGGGTRSGGTRTGTGGGNGGNGGQYGAGGAGGYAGSGGNGGSNGGTGTAGAGGGGGGGGGTFAAGGGVGLLGQGSNGTAGSGSSAGGGGSGGTNGGVYTQGSFNGSARGGNYGGGGGAGWGGGDGGSGAVRIIWPGTTRQFPSTNTGNL